MKEQEEELRELAEILRVGCARVPQKSARADRETYQARFFLQTWRISVPAKQANK